MPPLPADHPQPADLTKKISSGCFCWTYTHTHRHQQHHTCFPDHPFPPYTFPICLRLPLASLHVLLISLALPAVLYMPSARVRAQLSQQCFYCVVHMEKITATGQFSPWSYVNSFDGMSGLSPVCGGAEASEGVRCCINIQPQH